MKKTIATILAMWFITTCIFAQKITADKVPANVKAKLTALYPKVSTVKWEMEKGNYEAGFSLEKVETSVVINPAGDLLETETAIAISALPKGVAEYVAKNYPGAKIAEASKIVDAKGVVKYEAEVNKKDLLFDSNGKFLK